MLEDAKVKEEAPDTNRQSKGFSFIFLGWLFALLSTLFFPILAAAMGVICGYLAKKVAGREVHGTVIIIASIACGLFGILLGASL